MPTLRQILLAAVKSLLRGKSLLAALLALWTGASQLSQGPRSASASDSDSRPKLDDTAPAPPAEPRPSRTPDDFLGEFDELFLRPTEGAALAHLAQMLKAQFQDGLLTNPACMLPSYNHQLPSRSEHGRYLALDVGGSTLRVAVVQLRGRDADGSASRIVRQDSFKIDRAVKDLEGLAFFDWVAQKIVSTVSAARGPEHQDPHLGSTGPLFMGLAWSFPIEQTSLKGGKLQSMGKGFRACATLLGQDLGDIIKAACHARGLDVELAAIVNDSTAALLSEAYLNSSTRFSLILGTGVNIAVHLPVATVGRAKFGDRPATWFDKASHVIVNTELGMFGKGILPITRWDEALNAAHAKPDFQPLEHLVSGCYLGEMCRLALVEAVATTGVLGGLVPPSLKVPYSLDTETISFISGESPESSLALFKARHPQSSTPSTSSSSPPPPTPPEINKQDILFIRRLASSISQRSSAIIAACIFALWQFKIEAEAASVSDLENDAGAAAAREELSLDKHVVAFNGSVIECYPGYLQNLQDYLDQLITAAGGSAGTISLVGAKESSLLGAAVALACLEEGKAN
ncbi:hexokinase-1 [Coniella lustricola]|uniref:Phosphotransferase n=1 Tax=Coniella lustricola TaxID=2025994 RepID=A0A2T3A1D2_9PEZI|nr:hexokinase-1 [Coniella lustricola]